MWTCDEIAGKAESFAQAMVPDRALTPEKARKYGPAMLRVQAILQAEGTPGQRAAGLAHTVLLIVAVIAFIALVLVGREFAGRLFGALWRTAPALAIAWCISGIGLLVLAYIYASHTFLILGAFVVAAWCWSEIQDQYPAGEVPLFGRRNRGSGPPPWQ